MTRLTLPLCLLTWLTGCVGLVGEMPAAQSGAVPDAAVVVDDAGPMDAGVLVPDAGTPDAGAPDAGPIDAGPSRVPVFIAQGKLGRTMISCDDGRTWVADHSEKPNARCWDNTAAENIECDHNSWSSVGMIEVEGYFLATYGWGYPGVVRRSEDGIHWTDVLAGHTFAGMAYGNGRIMCNEHSPWSSADAGAEGTWTRGPDIPSVGWTVRRIGFLPSKTGGLGRFILTLDGEILLSDDNGATWQPPTTRPAACAVNTVNIVEGNSVALIFQGDGSVCRSVDRGMTWVHQPVAAAFSSVALFGGGAFYVWNGATRYRSTDGLTWVANAGTPADAEIGAVARSADGTFVATRGGWQVWYEKQRFYRSTDGITWDVLPAGAFVPSHPITGFVHGFAKPSAQCPLP